MAKFGGYEIHKLPGHYYTGEMEGSYPLLDNGSFKLIDRAREKAYKMVKNYGGVHHVFVPIGYNEKNGQGIITHYKSIGKAVNQKEGCLWVSDDGKRYKLYKNGKIRRL